MSRVTPIPPCEKSAPAYDAPNLHGYPYTSRSATELDALFPAILDLAFKGEF